MNSQNDKFHRTVCTYYFSWTPVLIGAFVGVGLGFLLDLFAMGIGLTSYTTDANGATALALGGFLGMIFGAFVTMFTAGFSAGYFAGPLCGKKNYGVVYGFVAWCLSLILMVLLASNLASYTAAKSHTQLTAPTTSEMVMTTKKVTDRLHPATDVRDTAAEKNVRAVGMISLSLFVLFIVGALSACFGGYFGMECWNKHSEKDRL
jgi:hypothetical protein